MFVINSLLSKVRTLGNLSNFNFLEGTALQTDFWDLFRLCPPPPIICTPSPLRYLLPDAVLHLHFSVPLRKRIGAFCRRSFFPELYEK